MPLCLNVNYRPLWTQSTSLWTFSTSAVFYRQRIENNKNKLIMIDTFDAVEDYINKIGGRR